MGTRISDFEFSAGPPIRRSRYPLAEWMDGSIWEIVQGEDFEGPPKHMQARLHHYAGNRGYVVRTASRYEEGRTSVIFQFRWLSA